MIENIEAARERDGDPREDRPEAVDAALDIKAERVGFENGKPLLDRPYEEYPTDPLKPSASDALEDVARHERVGDVSDVASELATTTETVRTALELHGIDTPKGGATFDRVAEDELEIPLHGTVNVDHLRTPVYEDARLLQHLYVECGLGVGEMKTLLERQMNRGRAGDQTRWGVGEDDIRGALEDVGLLEDAGSGRVNPKRAKDIRLGGASMSTVDEDKRGASGGLNVDVSDF
jgi:hypothetical protein